MVSPAIIVCSPTPLQVSGLAALAACHYLPDVREKVFTVLYKAINSTVKELQEAGKDAMKKVSKLFIEFVYSTSPQACTYMYKMSILIS